MNERVLNLLSKVNPKHYIISTEKGRLLTDSYMQTVSEPEVMRNAKALSNVLDNVPVYIQDGELIVGNAASKPGAVELTCLAGPWIQEEVDALKNEGFIVSKEDEAQIGRMREFWNSVRLARTAIFSYDEKL